MQGNSLTGTIHDLEPTGPGFQPCRVGFYAETENPRESASEGQFLKVLEKCDIV